MDFLKRVTTELEAAALVFDLEENPHAAADLAGALWYDGHTDEVCFQFRHGSGGWKLKMAGNAEAIRARAKALVNRHARLSRCPIREGYRQLRTEAGWEWRTTPTTAPSLSTIRAMVEAGEPVNAAALLKNPVWVSGLDGKPYTLLVGAREIKGLKMSDGPLLAYSGQKWEDGKWSWTTVEPHTGGAIHGGRGKSRKEVEARAIERAAGLRYPARVRKMIKEAQENAEYSGDS